MLRRKCSLAIGLVLVIMGIAGCGGPGGSKAAVTFEWDGVNRLGDLTLAIEPKYIALVEGLAVDVQGKATTFHTPMVGLSIRNSGKTAYTFQPASTFSMVYAQSQPARASYRQPTQWAIEGERFGTQAIVIEPGEQKRMILVFPRVDKGDTFLPTGVYFQDRSLDLPVPVDPSYWGIKTLSPEVEAELKKAKTLGDVALVAQLSYRVIPLGQEWP